MVLTGPRNIADLHTSSLSLSLLRWEALTGSASIETVITPAGSAWLRVAAECIADGGRVWPRPSPADCGKHSPDRHQGCALRGRRSSVPRAPSAPNAGPDGPGYRHRTGQR